MRGAGVDGFEMGRIVASAAEERKLGREFRAKRIVKAGRLRSRAGISQALACLADEARAFQARPGFHSQDGVVEEAEGRKPVEQRINPAIQRDVRRAHSAGGAVGGNLRRVGKVFSASSAKFAVMVSTVGLPSGKPADAGAHERVGREVTITFHPGDGNRRSGAVRKNLCEQARILVRNDAGGGPRDGRVAGRERVSALPESTARSVSGRALAAKRVLQDFRDQKRVDGSFAAQNARFLFIPK